MNDLFKKYWNMRMTEALGLNWRKKIKDMEPSPIVKAEAEIQKYESTKKGVKLVRPK